MVDYMLLLIHYNIIVIIIKVAILGKNEVKF